MDKAIMDVLQHTEHVANFDKPALVTSVSYW